MSDAVYPGLKGRTALVTGGASGIGEALVRGLVEQGARVGFIDRVADLGRELAAELSGAGADVAFANADLTDVAALRAAVQDIRAKLGPVTILINNAADDSRHSFLDLTPEDWDRRLAVNLTHYVFCAQAVVPDMRANGGGAIVNLSSISYLRGMSEMPAYTTAKAAIIGLTRGLAREFGPDEIRVNTVLPGWIMTQKQVSHHLTPEGEADMLRNQCLKRRLAPQELASVVLFLCSDAASACTNQSFVVDGGWT
ncbi:MAG: SDR family oxidoreductase [Beijerinckiaceae bacterium]|nr:SDR family oxidoreductase [Beijerinckiaceae bacterium]